MVIGEHGVEDAGGGVVRDIAEDAPSTPPSADHDPVHERLGRLAYSPVMRPSGVMSMWLAAGVTGRPGRVTTAQA